MRARPQQRPRTPLSRRLAQGCGPAADPAVDYLAASSMAEVPRSPRHPRRRQRTRGRPAASCKATDRCHTAAVRESALLARLAARPRGRPSPATVPRPRRRAGPVPLVAPGILLAARTPAFRPLPASPPRRTPGAEAGGGAAEAPARAAKGAATTDDDDACGYRSDLTHPPAPPSRAVRERGRRGPWTN